LRNNMFKNDITHIVSFVTLVAKICISCQQMYL